MLNNEDLYQQLNNNKGYFTGLVYNTLSEQNEAKNHSRYKVEIGKNLIIATDFGTEIYFGKKSNPKLNKIHSPSKNLRIYERQKKLQFLILNNFKDNDKFIVFTNKKNVTNRKKAIYQIKYFIKKLRKYKKGQIKYIIVPELQQRGAYHFNMITDCSYVDYKYLENVLWKRGSTSVSAIKDIYRTSCYLKKYLSKEKIFNSKSIIRSYMCSNGLRKSTRYINDDAIEIIKKLKNIKPVWIPKKKYNTFKEVYTKQKYYYFKNSDIEKPGGMAEAIHCKT